MTLRYKLANWISGGAFSAALDSAKHAQYDLTKAQKKWLDQCIVYEGSERLRNIATERSLTLAKVNNNLQSRLDMIASLETAGANATVKKMARIARGDMPVRVKS